MKNKILLLVIFLLAMAVFQVAASGIWDENKAVHIQAAAIEEATLVIGTHLIHLGSLTEEIYNIAKDSAEESAQHALYYKSELANGAWFEITTASALEDITTAGTPVEDKVIEGLFFTHHTKSDGITYDLRTGKAVNIFDIKDPYDLETMPELEPLKIHYDMMKQLQSDSANGKKKIARLEELFALDVENDKTKECDEILETLQVYLDVLKENNGGCAEISKVEGVMEAVDATRRTEVYQIVQDALTAYSLEQSSEKAESKEEDEEDDEATADEESPRMDTQLFSATSDSISNVETTLTNATGKMLDKGTTVLSVQVYNVSQALCQDALAKNHTGCDRDVAMLLAYDNILNGVVANKEVELQLLIDELLPKGEQKYTGGLWAGENDAYRQAVATKSASALLRGIAEEYTSQVNAYRSELEFFIEAYCLRITNPDGQTYMDERLQNAHTYYGAIKTDNFQEGMESSVDKHIEFLTKKKRALELAAGGNELDKLIVQKEELQTEQMTALDKNDLVGAQTVEEKIAKLDSQIAALSNNQVAQAAQLQSQLNDLQKQLNDVLQRQGATTEGTDGADTTTGEGTTDGGGNTAALSEKDAAKIAALRQQMGELSAELSAVQSSMSEGSLGGVVITLKNSCLSGIKGQAGNANGGGAGADSQTNANVSQNMASLSENIDALGNMLDSHYKTVFPAIQEVYEAMITQRNLNEVDKFDAQIAKIEDMILKSNGAYEAAMREEKNAEDLVSVADAFFAKESGLLDTGVIGNGAGAGGTAGAGSGAEGTAGTGGTAGAGSTAGTSSLLTVSEEKTPSDLTADEQAAVQLAALALLAEETQNSDAQDLLAVLALTANASGNPLVFQSYNDAAGQFVSVPAIAQYANMRYVWLHNQNEGTIAKGSFYYAFTGYSDKVIVGKGKVTKEYMTRPAMKKGDLYIPEDYARQQFGFTCIALPHTGYSVLIDDSLQRLSEQLCSQYLN